MRDSANLYVIAAPSGAGKTTLVRALTRRNPELRFSISYTTRNKRRSEAHGVDYLFVDREEFEALRENDELLESAEVFDNLYGTSRAQVQQHLADGYDVILEIDWQGARQVRASMPDCVTIFILPPSLEELEAVYEDIGSAVGYEMINEEITDWFVAGGLLLLALSTGFSLLWFQRLP